MNEAGGKREVAALAWPLAVGFLAYTLLGVVDTMLMGRVSTAAQAGVGLSVTIVFSFMAFFRGVTRGAQALVAAADGAGDEERKDRAAGAGLLLGLVSGLVAAFLLCSFANPILRRVVEDAEVLAAAQAYLGTRVWGLPFMLLGFGALAALQGVGDTKARMWASLVGNGVNGVLSLILVFGWGPIPAFGAAGAAAGSVAGDLLMALVYLVRFGQRFGWPRLSGVSVLKDALTLGLPDGLQCQGNVLAFLVMNLALARAGAEHLAASQIVLQLVSVSFLPGVGVGEAGGVLVGRYLGAGRPDLAARAMASARVLAVTAMSSLGLVFAFGGTWLASWFSQDPAVLALTGPLLLLAASFQVGDAVATVHLCALRGAGDVRFTLLATLGCAWGLLVPSAIGLGLGLGWGATGAWVGLLVEVSGLALLTAWRVRGLREGRVGRLDLLLGAAT